MSESFYDRYGRGILGGLVLGLAAISLIGGYYQLTAVGLAAAGDVLVSLYIAAIVVWGFFMEGFDTFRFRVLLYAGFVLWGTVDYLGGSDSAFTFVLIIGGSLLLARAMYKYTEQNRKPVYER